MQKALNITSADEPLPDSMDFWTRSSPGWGKWRQNADQLGSLAGLFLPTVYVGVVECAPASPYTYSSSTHRFPDERTPIEAEEATPLSATSAELGSDLGLGLGLGSHFSSHAPSHAPLLLATLLSHNIPFPRVHKCVMGKLVHTCLGSSYLIAHVLHCPPPPRRTQLYNRSCSNKHTRQARESRGPPPIGVSPRTHVPRTQMPQPLKSRVRDMRGEVAGA
jgi:hypothetical protein